MPGTTIDMEQRKRKEKGINQMIQVSVQQSSKFPRLLELKFHPCGLIFNFSAVFTFLISYFFSGTIWAKWSKQNITNWRNMKDKHTSLRGCSNIIKMKYKIKCFAANRNNMLLLNFGCNVILIWSEHPVSCSILIGVQGTIMQNVKRKKRHQVNLKMEVF